MQSGLSLQQILSWLQRRSQPRQGWEKGKHQSISLWTGHEFGCSRSAASPPNIKRTLRRLCRMRGSSAAWMQRLAFG
jgi:hypothetical protein